MGNIPMYAGKAFILQQAVREILVEMLMEEMDIDGENFPNFENWAIEVERQFTQLKDTGSDVQHQMDIRNIMTQASSTDVTKTGAPSENPAPSTLK